MTRAAPSSGGTGARVRSLLVDNYDSFTYNLFQLLYEINAVAPLVVRNDAMDWTAISRLDCDNVVISPGPGRPSREADFGVCADVIAHETRPLLGVCLGHQGMWLAAGGAIDRAPEPMHGRLSAVTHDGTGIFDGLPSPFTVVRYHSLAVTGVTPAALRVTARSQDGVIMGIAHRSRPQWGVQFHPESIASDCGRALLENFRSLTLRPDRASDASAPPRRSQA